MQYNRTIRNKQLTKVFQLFIINRIEEKVLGMMTGCVFDHYKMLTCSPYKCLYVMSGCNVLILADSIGDSAIASSISIKES